MANTTVVQRLMMVIAELVLATGQGGRVLTAKPETKLTAKRPNTEAWCKTR